MADSLFSVVRVPAPVRRQVEGGLRSMIAEGRLAPGERLVERDLCERLGVSRPVLREAMRQLEAEGLLTNVPHRGVVVSCLTVEEAREIYKVRALLEGAASESFAKSASDEDVASLEADTVAAERALAAGDAIGVRQAKNAFYETLIVGCGNGTLAQMLRILHNRIQLLRTVMLNEPGRMTAATTEIRAIYDAVAARDPPRARDLSRHHIRNAEKAMEAAFAAADRDEAKR